MIHGQKEHFPNNELLTRVTRSRCPSESAPCKSDRHESLCHHAEITRRNSAVAEYDVFILGGQRIPFCRRGSGFDAAGLDYLMGKRTEYYVRRQRDRTLMKGDRVAIHARGIAVVERADEAEVHALLRNRIVLRMRRKDIVWSRQNMRWEAEVLAPQGVQASALNGHEKARSADESPVVGS
jgi:hypothetical protein